MASAWKFDEATRADIDAAVFAAFDSSAKQAAYGNAVVGAFRVSPQLHLFRAGQELTPIPLGAPSVIGSTVVFAQRIVTVTQGQAWDIDSGAWQGEVRSGTGRVATPASIGRTGTVVRISDDFIAGAVVVTVTVTINLPSFGAGSGGGGGGVDPGTGFVAGSPPGSGWTTVLAATGPAFAVPAAFYGWHRDGNLGAPGYEFGIVRSIDYTPDGDTPTLYWAWIERNQGTFDWSGMDAWIASTPGKTRIWTLFQTPAWATSKNDGSADLYGGLAGGSWPPRDMAWLDRFLTALRNRYPPSVIHFIEGWNEPDTYNHSDPAARNPNGRMFYKGNMFELVEMHRRAKLVFTDRPVLCGGWNSQLNFQLFLRTSDGHGGYGADHFDWLAFHAYMYSFNPQNARQQARDYRSILQQAAQSLSRPALATKPIIDTEIGHEADGRLATDTDVGTIARNMKQVVGYSVAAAIEFGNRGVVLYADKSNPRTFRGPINATPALKEAAQYCHAVEGKTVRQCSIKPDGGNPGVWLRFSDNSEYLA